jgi:hypothetical protein
MWSSTPKVTFPLRVKNKPEYRNRLPMIKNFKSSKFHQNAIVIELKWKYEVLHPNVTFHFIWPNWVILLLYFLKNHLRLQCDFLVWSSSIYKYSQNKLMWQSMRRELICLFIIACCNDVLSCEVTTLRMLYEKKNLIPPIQNKSNHKHLRCISILLRKRFHFDIGSKYV